MQQNVIKNKFNCEYAPLATLQPNLANKFKVDFANNLNLNRNNSRLHVLAKITKADRTNIDVNRAGLINLTLHLMFREIKIKLNNRNVGNTSQLYPYRVVLESLLHFWK